MFGFGVGTILRRAFVISYLLLALIIIVLLWCKYKFVTDNMVIALLGSKAALEHVGLV